MSVLADQPYWLKIALATLGAVLLAAAFTVAWSNDFHRDACTKAIAANTGTTIYLGNCLSDASALMDESDPILNDSMQGSICESFFYGFVDQSIHDKNYEAQYYCALNNKTYSFTKPYYEDVVNAVITKLGANTTIQLESIAPTLPAVVTPQSTDANATAIIQPPTYGNAAANEADQALRQYLADLRQQTIDAEVELRVKERLAGYSCFYSSARKIEMYKRWNTLTPSAKTCLPSFLALNKTTYSAFASQCAEFPFNADKNYAAYLARAVLDEYARNEFAVTTSTKVKILMPDDSATDASEIPFTYQEVLVYTPYEVTAGCLIEFQDKLDSENNLFGAGFNNAAILITALLCIAIVIAVAWFSYSRW